jgi:hypothetical protein
LKIEETTLTGLSNYKERENQKNKWLTSQSLFEENTK